MQDIMDTQCQNMTDLNGSLAEIARSMSIRPAPPVYQHGAAQEANALQYTNMMQIANSYGDQGMIEHAWRQGYFMMNGLLGQLAQANNFAMPHDPIPGIATVPAMPPINNNNNNNVTQD